MDWQWSWRRSIRHDLVSSEDSLRQLYHLEPTSTANFRPSASPRIAHPSFPPSLIVHPLEGNLRSADSSLAVDGVPSGKTRAEGGRRTKGTALMSLAWPTWALRGLGPFCFLAKRIAVRNMVGMMLLKWPRFLISDGRSRIAGG